jgi:hypothetical protein
MEQRAPSWFRVGMTRVPVNYVTDCPRLQAGCCRASCVCRAIVHQAENGTYNQLGPEVVPAPGDRGVRLKHATRLPFSPIIMQTSSQPVNRENSLGPTASGRRATAALASVKVRYSTRTLTSTRSAAPQPPSTRGRRDDNKRGNAYGWVQVQHDPSIISQTTSPTGNHSARAVASLIAGSRTK